jgi:hypothetical protein
MMPAVNDGDRLATIGSDNARALLRAGLDERPNAESVRKAERVLGLAQTAAATVGLAGVLAGLFRAKGALWISASMLVTALVAGAVGARAHFHMGSRTAAPSLARVPATGALAAGQSVHSSAGAESQAAATEAAPELPLPGAVGSPGADSVDREVALLDNARARESAADPAGALRVLDDYRRAFPAGALVEEAEVLRIEALRARGDASQTAQRASAFLARWPQSVHAPAVRAALAAARR